MMEQHCADIRTVSAGAVGFITQLTNWNETVKLCVGLLTMAYLAIRIYKLITKGKDTTDQ